MTATPPCVTAVRHGETPWSLTGRHTGTTDLDLTDGGADQAAALGSLLSGVAWDLVLCSPMRRAERTAEIAGLSPYEIDDNLREWDYGDLEGLTSAEIGERYAGWTIWDGPWPGGEDPSSVAARADAVVGRVLAQPPGAKVAVVSHGHLLRVLAARWLGEAPEAGRRFALGTATVSELGWEHGAPVISCWNVAARPQR